MLVQNVKYTNFNGEEVEETVYFHISKAELIGMKYDGFVEAVEKMKQTKNEKDLYNAFLDIVKMSYGVKSEDGRRFIKDEDLTQEFIQTAAFDQIWWKMFTDPNYSIEFINGVIPDNLDYEIRKAEELRDANNS